MQVMKISMLLSFLEKITTESPIMDLSKSEKSIESKNNKQEVQQ